MTEYRYIGVTLEECDGYFEHYTERQWEERAREKQSAVLGVVCPNKECLKPITQRIPPRHDNCQCGEYIPLPDVVRVHGLESLSGFCVAAGVPAGAIT